MMYIAIIFVLKKYQKLVQFSRIENTGFLIISNTTTFDPWK